MPWRNMVFRYLHCFSKRELKKIVKEKGFKIREIGVSEFPETKESDIYLIAEK